MECTSVTPSRSRDTCVCTVYLPSSLLPPPLHSNIWKPSSWHPTPVLGRSGGNMRIKPISPQLPVLKYQWSPALHQGPVRGKHVGGTKSSFWHFPHSTVRLAAVTGAKFQCWSGYKWSCDGGIHLNVGRQSCVSMLHLMHLFRWQNLPGNEAAQLNPFNLLFWVFWWIMS